MGKVRIYQVAKEAGLPAEKLVAELRKMGVEVKSNLSAVEVEVAARATAALKAVRPAPAVKPPSRTTSERPAPRAPTAGAVAPAKTPGATRPSASPAPAPTRHTPSPAMGATRPVTRPPSPAAPTGARVTPSTQHGPARIGSRPGFAPRPAGSGSPMDTRRPILIPAPGPPRPGAPPRPGPGTPPPRAAGSPTHAGGTRPGGHPTSGSRTFQARAAPPMMVPPRPGYGRPHAPPRLPGRRGPGERIPERRSPSERLRTPPPVATPPLPPPDPSTFKEITITEGVTVKELAEKTGRKSRDIIKSLMEKGILATINQALEGDTVRRLCNELGFRPNILSFEENVAFEEQVAAPEETGQGLPRAPVVTMMGHVDHGKTSLLDAIRETKVAEGEHGGITQHIGAYHVDVGGRQIVFLDTPGHEAFTKMRARGAQVTDLVVLVVAADDGVMPQTIEAIHHARAAKVAIIVALNKMDKPEANPDRVKKALSENGVLVEEWGGEVVCVPVSARQRTGIDQLLEMILLTGDMLELRANPNRLAAGTVLEARLDRARGPIATLLVQKGTLKVGDPFIVGAEHGKVRALIDDRGRRVEKAGPATPVEVLGLEGVPAAGDLFQALSEDRRARQIGAYRQEKLRREKLLKSSRLTLDHLFEQIKGGVVKELPIVLKADVHGSAEVLTKTLEELSTEKVKVKVIHQATGAINDSDVLLASASNAIVVGFNVRPERTAEALAEKEGVDLRLHTVIYNITNEIKNAMVGLLEPTFREVYLGRADVRETFKVPKAGLVAGCSIIDGRFLRTAEARLLRDNIVIYEGRISSLRRFKDDVSEVKTGFECGIGLDKFNDIKIGDVIEAFKVEKVVPREL